MLSDEAFFLDLDEVDSFELLVSSLFALQALFLSRFSILLEFFLPQPLDLPFVLQFFYTSLILSELLKFILLSKFFQ